MAKTTEPPRIGRPPIGASARTIMAYCRINAEEKKALDAAARRQKQPPSTLIRTALRAYLALTKEQ